MNVLLYFDGHLVLEKVSNTSFKLIFNQFEINLIFSFHLICFANAKVYLVQKEQEQKRERTVHLIESLI